MNFEESVEAVISLEGGEQIINQNDDSGGLTKYGISARNHPELGEDGVRALTKAEAVGIYRRAYWEQLGLDSIPAFIRLPIFDSAVNMGKTAAALLVQNTLVGLGRKIAVDGIIGVKTLMALQSVNGTEFAVEFLFQRLESYRKMKTFSVFGRGWIKRVLRIALAMR